MATRNEKRWLSAGFQGFRQCLYKIAYFVADSAVYVESFLFGFGLFGKSRRVIKTNVNSFSFARKDGALFISIIADRYNIIELNTFKFAEVL